MGSYSDRMKSYGSGSFLNPFWVQKGLWKIRIQQLPKSEYLVISVRAGSNNQHWRITRLDLQAKLQARAEGTHWGVQSDDGPCRHFGQNVFSFREFPLSSKGCFTFLLIPDSWISRFPDSRLSARVKAAVAAVREKWGFEAAGRDAASPRMCKMFS